ncbi:MAG: aspartate--tRNA ligase [Candidatus Micrarchaeia archaeon]
MEINCNSLTERDVGKKVSLFGWSRYIRDHGGKLFIDLADRHGTLQLVLEGENLKKAEEIGKEYVLKVTGTVRLRSEDTIDKENPTGKIELFVESFEVINKSKIPPFELIEEKKKFLANEELRMQYRYLDLRRREMIKNIEFRDKVTKTIRKFLWSKEFLELETPTLIKDTYETGSRTFIVPSRTNPDKFYSLPQSPQIYKQLCMISGLEKYFQVARCYRDEDPREDRQPEFTQIDIEVSFKDESYIQSLIEELIETVFKDVMNKKLNKSFRHMLYKDAIKNYGSDKPDLRFDSKILDITEEVKLSDYNMLKRVISANGTVKAMCFDANFGKEDSKIDKNYMLKLIELTKEFGLGGMTWLYIKEGKLTSEPSSIVTSLGSSAEKIQSKLNAKEGNIILVFSDVSEALLLNVMGKIRNIVGTKIGKFSEEYSFLWIDEFPMFEKDEITGKLKPAHNPFSSPTEESFKYLKTEPEKAVARQYDLVLNGYEIASGSIRIKDSELQRESLKKMGMSDETINETFGFFIKALEYGAPIHGGIALGFDRLVTLLSNSENIRDFILFPKNKKYESLIDGSPTLINKKRLKDDFGITISR